VYPNKIDVLVASGSGQSFVSSEFSGTGVSNFTARTGAKVDASLSEVTAANAKRGSIGAVTSVSGTIQCGNQTPGASMVVFSGSTAEGSLSGPANPYRVACNKSTQGRSVSFVGVLKVGATSALFQTTLTQSGVTIFESTSSWDSHKYQAQGAGLATLTGQGATVNAAVVEQSVSSGAPHTIHLGGSLTCGTILGG
jgi:hypothetical protein